MRDNRRLRIYIMLLPLLAVIAGYTVYSELLPLIVSEDNAVNNNSKARQDSQAGSSKKSSAAAKMSKKELEAAIAGFRKENKTLVQAGTKIKDKYDHYFWRQSHDGDPVKKLPVLIDAAVKEHSLKLHSLSGLSQRKLTDEVTAVKIACSVSGSYIDILKFIGSLEHSEPKILWNRSSFSAGRANALAVTFKADANIMLLKDKDFEQVFFADDKGGKKQPAVAKPPVAGGRKK